MIGKHQVTVLVEGQEIDGWTNYSISTSLLTPSDGFTMTRPHDNVSWELCQTDAEVTVLVDGVAIVTGFIDEVDLPPDSDDMTITGRDKVGRLVQESAPAFEFAGLSTLRLIEKLVDPWFTVVAGANTRNRKIVRGKKGKIAGASPVVIKTKKTTGSRIEPGQTRWAAMEQILEQTGDIAISSGDGKELIVFTPTAETQEAQFRFFRPAAGSRRGDEGNCKMGHKQSLGDLYSRIDVVGSGVGDANRYGVSVSARTGNARDSEGSEDGTGGRFVRPKRLLLVESVRSLKEAQEFARREMARRLASWLRVTVIAPMHGQQIQGGRDVTLFACDCIAAVENEQTGLKMNMRIVSCEYTSERGDGEQTRMELIPEDQELFL